MSHHRALERAILEWIPQDLKDYRILDAGMGFGEWGYLLRSRLKGDPVIHGLDIWAPYVQRQHDLMEKNRSPYDWVVCWDLSDPLPYMDKIYDIILCIEVLEHNKYHKGIKILKNLEGACKGELYITTPLGFREGAKGYKNPYLEHVSGWTLEFFKNEGFEVQLAYLKNYSRVRKIIRALTRKRRHNAEILAKKIISPLD